MKRGDIVVYQGRSWLVQMYDAKRLRVAQLLADDGTAVEIAHDLDATEPKALQVLSNPSADWPFLMVPEKPRWGQVTQISRVQGRQLVPLAPVLDWVFSDPLRSGGSLFLRPALGLKVGDVIQVQFTKPGYMINVPIPRAYGTIKQRQAQAVAPKVKRGPATSFDRLLSDDEGFDE